MTESPIPSVAESKVASLVSTYIYRIATGKWREGERLPSVREAGESWRVDRRTVLAAYRELKDRGLVRRVPRSGFFVATGPDLGRVSRHRRELERLYERIEAEIEESTGLHPLGVLRYFVRLAEQGEAERPRYAFVECTMIQARGHALEVVERLGVSCAAVTVGELDGRSERLPLGVNTLFVSRFHFGELRETHFDAELVSVPVELSPELVDSLPARTRRVVVLDTEEAHVDDLLRDIRSLDPPWATEARVVEDASAAIRELSKGGEVLLFSPRLWGSLDPAQRDHPASRELAFRIVESAWPSMADAAGLPLGDCEPPG